MVCEPPADPAHCSISGCRSNCDASGVQVKGSATACILRCLPDEGELHAANLGDSGFLLVRGGNPVFQTPQQQHHFNFPYQLGSKAQGAMNDGPESAQVPAIGPPASRTYSN